MENLVLYRKYRPKTFGEVVGQEHIITTLTNAIEMGKVAHAYLFCGPRGTGKTTIARLLAKAVNCEKRDGHEPCNKCASCVEINAGRALDLVEVDAASNRGIDEIRELREGIKFSPNRLKFKVFIVDEVHMLTREAFNALLKTLEEPPEHAIFILATTEIHKVPQTIISRCQRFDFHKLTVSKLVGRLKNIVKNEKVKIDQEALELIAANADGGARDAESLLGQVIALEDKNITLEEVKTILGITDISATIEMSDLFLKKSPKEALMFLNKLAEEGCDMQQYCKSLINYFRKMMVLSAFSKSNPDEKSAAKIHEFFTPDFTKEQFAKIFSQSQSANQQETVKILKTLIKAENEIKSASLPQMPLELVIIETIG